MSIDKYYCSAHCNSIPEKIIQNDYEENLFPAIPPWGFDAERLCACSLQKSDKCQSCWHYWPRTLKEHMSVPVGKICGKWLVKFTQVGWRERT